MPKITLNISFSKYFIKQIYDHSILFMLIYTQGVIHMKLRLFIIICSLFILSACSTESGFSKPENNDVHTSVELVEMTSQELSQYDGRNGNKAYIAVNGVIYDVTGSSLWVNGSHNGHQAGRDLSTEILSSPHGYSTLSRFPIVGSLVDTP